jgi:uncharacterized membrane protein YgcG
MMPFWLAVILICGLLLLGMIGILVILARGSNAKRRWTLVGLLLNEEMNAPAENTSNRAKGQRVAKKLLREQHSHLHSKSTTHHPHQHGGIWGTGHHGSPGASHHGGGFDSGGGFHGGGHHG